MSNTTDSANAATAALPLAPCSGELIADAKATFDAMARYGFEWRSFYNGYLEGFAATVPAKHELIELLERGLKYGIVGCDCYCTEAVHADEIRKLLHPKLYPNTKLTGDGAQPRRSV